MPCLLSTGFNKYAFFACREYSSNWNLYYLYLTTNSNRLFFLTHCKPILRCQGLVKWRAALDRFRIFFHYFFDLYKLTTTNIYTALGKAVSLLIILSGLMLFSGCKSNDVPTPKEGEFSIVIGGTPSSTMLVVAQLVSPSATAEVLSISLANGALNILSLFLTSSRGALAANDRFDATEIGEDGLYATYSGGSPNLPANYIIESGSFTLTQIDRANQTFSGSFDIVLTDPNNPGDKIEAKGEADQVKWQ